MQHDRRHLNESQRAMVAVKLETMKHGDNQHSKGDANWHVLREDAASCTERKLLPLASDV